MKINLIKLINKSNNNYKLLNKILMINNNTPVLHIMSSTGIPFAQLNSAAGTNINLQSKQLNNNHQWNIIIYNYNKNNELNNIINNNIVIQLLYKIINIINGNKLFISKPLFKHNINSVVIKFYYYNIDITPAPGGAGIPFAQQSIAKLCCGD